MNIDNYRETIILGAIISALIVPIPDTKCCECKYREYTRFQKLTLGYPRATSMDEFFRIAMGGVPYSSYRYHRELWIKHGDVKELTRMIRHVTITE